MTEKMKFEIDVESAENICIDILKRDYQTVLEGLMRSTNKADMEDSRQLLRDYEGVLSYLLSRDDYDYWRGDVYKEESYE